MAPTHTHTHTNTRLHQQRTEGFKEALHIVTVVVGAAKDEALIHCKRVYHALHEGGTACKPR